VVSFTCGRFSPGERTQNTLYIGSWTVSTAGFLPSDGCRTMDAWPVTGLPWPILNPDGKVKVKLSLCLTKHHAMKTYWVSGGIAPGILRLGTR